MSTQHSYLIHVGKEGVHVVLLSFETELITLPHTSLLETQDTLKIIIKLLFYKISLGPKLE